MTIKELHKEWFAYKEKRVKQTSLSCYEIAYSLHIEPYFKPSFDISVGINNKQMNSFVEHLVQEKNLSLKSTTDAKIVLVNMLKFGSIAYDIPTFTYMIEYPKQTSEKKDRIKFFTRDQCKKVFAKMDEDPSSELLGLVIGLTTGMRIGELTGLRFSDVDFTERTISVNRTIERVQLQPGDSAINLDGVEVLSRSRKSALVVNTPKTVSSRRTCPLTALPFKWIKNYAKISTPERYIIGLGKHPVEPRTYRNAYYNILESLGLPALNPHCMRHTFATQMLHSGVDPATTANVLGHSNPSITLEIYSHTNEDEKRKQVNAVFGKMFR